MGEESLSTCSRPIISVNGWYDHGNCGDESYKLSFPKLFPQCEFTFGGKPSSPSSSYVLGGGDIICDQYLKILQNLAPKHILSASMSVPNEGIANFDTVALRDFRSIENAAEAGVAARYCPDFAFALDGNAENGKKWIAERFTQERHDLYSKIIVVVINGHLHGGHQQHYSDQVAFQHMATELASTLDNTPASVVFLPFGTRQPWDDRVANGWVASKCKFWKKNIVVYDLLSVQNTLDIIAAADVVISTRLHSTIFSCITARPFIDITHNHKNLGLLETLQLMDYSISYRSVAAKNVSVNLNSILNDADRISDELQKITTKQRAILREFVQNVRFV